MLMNRRTFVVKRGRMEEAIKLLQAEAQRSSRKNHSRIYTPEVAAFDVICAEIDFDNLSQYEQYWADYFEQPEAAAFLERWVELTETGGTNEIWQLVE